MARIKTRLPKFRIQILLWVVGVLVLGAIAWGLGWSLHGVLYPPVAPPPTAPMGTLSTPWYLPTPTPVPTSAVSPTPRPTGVTQPTSTLLPTSPSTSTPVAGGKETVQQGDTLYQVCRRHCPHRWSPESGAYDADLVAYAEQVALLNSLRWPDPPLSIGRTLAMPPCP